MANSDTLLPRFAKSDMPAKPPEEQVRNRTPAVRTGGRETKPRPKTTPSAEEQFTSQRTISSWQ